MTNEDVLKLLSKPPNEWTLEEKVDLMSRCVAELTSHSDQVIEKFNVIAELFEVVYSRLKLIEAKLNIKEN